MNTCYDIHESGLKSNILWVSNGRKVMYGGNSKLTLVSVLCTKENIFVLL